MRLAFAKYSGCGNDFILVDNRKAILGTPNASVIAKLCHRRFGIGADGVILLENSSRSDFRMRIYNSDGTEAEMCGNGIRCLMRFLQHLGYRKNVYTIETMERTLKVMRRGELVAVEMGAATDIRWHVQVDVAGKKYVGHHLNTGVPHLVIPSDDLSAIDVPAEGAALRYHPHFSPKGVNVNFVGRLGNSWGVRTYERGVEDETLACGTGATATAIALAHTANLPSPIQLKTRSGDILEIAFDRQGDTFNDIELRGPAMLVFRGSVNCD